MVSCLYDTAVYYSSAEYEALTGIKEDVQANVECPEVYIVARSSSSDAEQLAYVETRVECLKQLDLKLVTKSGHHITDVMRFFHGDAPARQFEWSTERGALLLCGM